MMKVGKRNVRWSDIDMSQLDLSNLIVHFAQSNKVEGKSPKTVSWYSEMLTSYAKHLEAIEIQPTLAELDITNVREFIIHEQGRQVSPFTVACKVRALKAFASWLLREGYTTCNILANLKPYKTPKKMIEPLTPDEINKLMSAQNPLTAIGSRNIAILTTFLDTGMRENELSGLYFEDAHIEEGFLKVMGKGSKERILPIGVLEQKVLWRYVLHFRHFVQQSNNPSICYLLQLTIKSIFIQFWLFLTNLIKHLSPYFAIAVSYLNSYLSDFNSVFT